MSGSVALAGLSRLLFLLHKPVATLVQHIPDDAFYYLVPARNFAGYGRWTFDGVEPATGFHLLWGYVLASLFAFVPQISLHGIVLVCGLLQVCCLALGAYLLTRSGVRLFGRGAGLGVGAVFLSSVVLVQGGWLMESAAVIAIGAVVVDRLCRPACADGPIPLASYLLIGWLLELARSDAGLLAFALLVMHVVLWQYKAVDRSMPKAATLVFIGAVLGIGTTLLHTHLVSGVWVQASARQKLYWSSVSAKPPLQTIADEPLAVLQPLRYAIPGYGHPLPAPFLHRPNLFRRFYKAGTWFTRATLFLVAIGILAGFRKRSMPARASVLTLFLLVVAYCAFYRHDAAVQDWYVSNFVAPMAMLTAASVAWFYRRHPTAVAGFVLVLVVPGLTYSFITNYPWQECMYRGGLYLNDQSTPGLVGSFNSGILGFFSKRPVTNLDGLVNDRLFPSSSRGDLAGYMARRHVTTIFDFSIMLESPVMQARGGYADGRLLRCVRSRTDPFSEDPHNNLDHSHLELYRLDESCLR